MKKGLPPVLAQTSSTKRASEGSGPSQSPSSSAAAAASSGRSAICW